MPHFMLWTTSSYARSHIDACCRQCLSVYFQVGHDFVTAIVAHVASLSAHPDIDRVVPEFDDELIRELTHAPFCIVYLRERKSVNIIRVCGSERLLNLPKQS
jgi:toxin ParE1/3/4